MASSRFTQVIVAVVFAAAVSAQQQRAVLFDQYNGDGNFIIIPGDYVNDLSSLGWDNKVRSVCVTGVWLFYQDVNYNIGGPRGMEYVFGRDNYCVNINSIPNHISSLRFSGARDTHTIDSLTIYQGDYFQGAEEYTLTDKPSLNLAGDHQSIIVTGDSNWSIYDLENYRGVCLCLRVPEPGTNTPSFIADLQNLNPSVPHGSIRSIRKGCPPADICDRTVMLSSFERMNHQNSFAPANVY